MEKVHLASLHFKINLISKYFSRWRDMAIKENVNHRENDLARIYIEDRLYKHTFRLWLEKLKQKQLQNEIERFQLSQYVFYKWWNRLQAIRHNIEKAETYFMKNQLKKSFHQWRSKLLILQVRRNSEFCYKRRIFKLWKLKLLKRKIQRKLARSHYNKQLTTKFFLTWKTRLNYWPENATIQETKLHRIIQTIYFETWKLKLQRKIDFRKSYASAAEANCCHRKKQCFVIWKHKLDIINFKKRQLKRKNLYLLRKYSKRWKLTIKKKKLIVLLEKDWIDIKNQLLVKYQFYSWYNERNRIVEEQTLVNKYHDQLSLRILQNTFREWKCFLLLKYKERRLKREINVSMEKQCLLVWKEAYHLQIKENVFKMKRIQNTEYSIFSKWREQTFTRKMEKRLKDEHENEIINKTIIIWQDYCGKKKEMRNLNTKKCGLHWIKITRKHKQKQLKCKAYIKWSYSSRKTFFEKWKEQFELKQIEVEQANIKAGYYFNYVLQQRKFTLWKRQYCNEKKLNDSKLLKLNQMKKAAFVNWKSYIHSQKQINSQVFMKRISDSKYKGITSESSTLDYKQRSYGTCIETRKGDLMVDASNRLYGNHNTAIVDPESSASYQTCIDKPNEESSTDNCQKIRSLRRIIIYWKNNSIAKTFYSWFAFVQKRQFLLQQMNYFELSKRLQCKKDILSVWYRRLLIEQKIDSFYRNQLLKKSLTSLVLFIAMKRKQEDLIILSLEYWRKNKFKLAIRQWRSQFQLRVNLRDKINKWRHAVALSKQSEYQIQILAEKDKHRKITGLQNHFHLWRENALKYEESKKFYASLLLKRCFREWRFFIHNNQEYVTRVQQVKNSSILSKWFYRWKENLMALNEKKKLMYVRNMEIIREYFTTWRSWTIEKQCCKRKLKLMEEKRRKESLVMYFNKWHAVFRLVVVVKKVSNSFTERRVINGWFEYQKKQKNLKRYSEKLKKQIKVNTLQRYFFIWVDLTASVKMKEKFCEQRNEILLYTTMGRWRDIKNKNKIKKKVERNIYQNFFSHWKLLHSKTKKIRQLEMMVITQWKFFIQQRKSNHLVCDRYLHRRSQHLLAFHYQLWQSNIMKLKIGREHRQNKLLQRYFGLWVCSVKESLSRQCNERVFHEMQSKKLVISTFAKWKNEQILKKSYDQRKQEISACHWYNQNLCKSFFTFWKEYHNAELYRKKRTKFLMEKYSTIWRHRCQETRMIIKFFKKESMRNYWCKWRLHLVQKRTIEKIQRFDDRKLLRNVLLKWAYHAKREDVS